MNSRLYFSSATLAAAALLSSCQSNVGAPTWEDSRVNISFENPDDFTDFKDGLVGTERGREDHEYQLRRAITETAANRLKDGQRLSISFTDIDLAGDYLPSAHTGHDVRVIKEIYAPRMAFRYTLTDANGAVIKEGTENFRDTAFQYRTGGLDRNEALYYDKELIRDWIRKTVR